MKFISAAILWFYSVVSFAQVIDPVGWSISVEATDEANIYEVIVTASIEDDWVIYSKETEEDGPIPTSFSIAESASFTLIGEYTESKDPKTAYSDLFELNVSKFEKEVSLIQKIKLVDSSADIHASVVFMTCSGDRCLPPKEVILQTKI